MTQHVGPRHPRAVVIYRAAWFAAVLAATIYLFVASQPLVFKVFAVALTLVMAGLLIWAVVEVRRGRRGHQ